MYLILLYAFYVSSTHCIGFIMTASFYDGGNQYTLIGEDSVLQTARYQ